MARRQEESQKVAILSVTNDLLTDQRVHKTALSLIKMGYTPMLVGRMLNSSKEILSRQYKIKRFILPFAKGPFFYAIFNFRLLIFLLSRKTNLLISNDLDTLLANFIAFRIKKVFGNKNLKLVYDSHELFTEVPELNGRNFAKKSWLFIERLILPKIKNSSTVCESIALYYNKKYRINMQVIRNLPLSSSHENYSPVENIALPSEKKIILYQGALNMGRGIEHIIDLMDSVDSAIFVIAGSGDQDDKLHAQVKVKHMENKVLFTGKIPFEQLKWLTKRAHVGLVLQEDISLSYRYVLPNRLFDFINAEIPVLASNLPEIRAIVEKEKIGLLVDGFEREVLLKNLHELLQNTTLYNTFKQNLRDCKSEYTWKKEESKLNKIYTNLQY